MESDIRYYQRRVREEMGAARRAVTGAARERRLQLVDLYIQRLDELQAPSPIRRRDLAAAFDTTAPAHTRSAFAWLGADGVTG